VHDDGFSRYVARLESQFVFVLKFELASTKVTVVRTWEFGHISFAHLTASID
jgi:hypothetical protein